MVASSQPLLQDAEPHQTLLWFLRERLGLTGGDALGGFGAGAA